MKRAIAGSLKQKGKNCTIEKKSSSTNRVHKDAVKLPCIPNPFPTQPDDSNAPIQSKIKITRRIEWDFFISGPFTIRTSVDWLAYPDHKNTVTIKHPKEKSSPKAKTPRPIDLGSLNLYNENAPQLCDVHDREGFITWEGPTRLLGDCIKQALSISNPKHILQF